MISIPTQWICLQICLFQVIMFITILLTQAMILRNLNTMYLSCCIIMFNSNVQLPICNCNCDPQMGLETPNKCQLLINCLSCAIFSTSNKLRFCVKYYNYNFFLNYYIILCQQITVKCETHLLWYCYFWCILSLSGEL